MIRSRFAVIGAVFYIGFLISSYIGSYLSFAVFAVLGAGAAVFAVKKKKAAVFVLAAGAAAFLFSGIYSRLFIDPCSSLYGQTYTVSASVISAESPDNDTVRVTAVSVINGTSVKYSFRTADTGISAGDEAVLTVKFSEPASNVSYNSAYDYSRGIFVRASVKDMEITGHGSGGGLGGVISGYSAYLRGKVAEELTGDEGGLLLAMFFGDRSALSPELSSAVRRSGLSHMTSVSGIHISLIMIILVFVLDLFGMRGRPRLKFCFVAVLAAVFCVFFNMSVSVIRSSLMFVMCYGAVLFRRKPASLNSLGFAVLVLLIAEPCACRDTGLAMSVCGTVGAGTLAPKLCAALGRHFRIGNVAEAVISAVCATCCTMPVSVLAFGELSLFSPITSTLIYPFFFAAMILTAVFAFSGGLLAPVCLVPAGAVLTPVVKLAEWAGSLRYSCISVDSGIAAPFFAASLVFMAVCFVLTRRKSAYRTALRAGAGVLCLCAFAGIIAVHRAYLSGFTKITVCSDGRNFLTAISGASGVSVYCSDVSRSLTSLAGDILTDSTADGFLLMYIMSEKDHGEAYSGMYERFDAMRKISLENEEHVFDISGEYTVTLYENAVETEINGVSIIMTDAASADTYGPHDIAVYSGYKKSAAYGINGITVLCDKRYTDADDAYSAWVGSVVILIAPDGGYILEQE